MTDDRNQPDIIMVDEDMSPDQVLESSCKQPSCSVCGTTSRLRRCSQCRLAYYCSHQHQRTDWRNHKNLCKKFDNNKMSKSLPVVSNVMSSRSVPSGSTVQWRAQQSTSTNSVQSIYGLESPFSQPSVVTYDSPEFALSMELEPDSYDRSTIIHQQQQQQQQQMGNQLCPDTVQQVSGYSFTEATDQMLDNMNQLRIPGEGTSESEILSATGEAVGQLPLASAELLAAHSEQTTRMDTRLAPPTNTSDTSDNRLMDERVHQPDMSSSREILDLCRTIINDLNSYGLSVLDNFLGRSRGLQILREVHNISQAGVFRDGQVVSNPAEKDLKLIRGDKITWVGGTENGCLSIGYLINQIDAVVTLANKMHNNGELGKFKIRERTKAMIACYPGSGAHYVMHVDNPNQDGRVITAIYYLNLNWNANMSGGALRIFPEQGKEVAYIEPIFDRIIFFWSDRRNPHEVQPSHRTRYAITVWYFDADEREKALKRVRHKKEVQHCKTGGGTTQNSTTNRIPAAT